MAPAVSGDSDLLHPALVSHFYDVKLCEKAGALLIHLVQKSTFEMNVLYAEAEPPSRAAASLGSIMNSPQRRDLHAQCL